MGAQENLKLIEEVLQALRDRDYDRYGALLAEDAVFRLAGVPAGMGGVFTGRQAIVDQMRQVSGTFETKEMFGDGEHVCLVGKVSAQRFPGNQFLQGVERPYSTYECLVYRIAGGKVVEWTAYLNWLDPMVQVGLVDASTLTR
jgi:ketosteroid isomerase-like protein